MIDVTLQVLTFAACVIIYAKAEPVLPRSGPETPLTIGIAAHFLTVGSVWIVASILFGGYVPNIGVTIACIGFAALLLCGRRVDDLRMSALPHKHEGLR
jgi:hypothetical protein